MKITRAAICHGRDLPFTLEDVELDELRNDEILVRIVACGICHTDLAVRDQHLPVSLPAVLGHEGAGVVERVGSGVSAVQAGDRVVISFNSCGRCPNCQNQAPTYCYRFFAENWSGTRSDGSPTMFLGGKKMNANFFGQSSFAAFAIAHERNVIRVPQEGYGIPLERLAPLGCGLMTGAGAVLRSMKVQSGMPIAIFGQGSVGLAAVMASKIAGADPIIAVDVNHARLKLANELGATHIFHPGVDVTGAIKQLIPQGIAYAFDTTGLATVIQDAFDLLAPKGILGIVGASAPDQTLTFNESRFMGGGRTVMGILGGDSDIDGFVKELIGYHIEGVFPFERLITYFDFADINRAVEAGERGEVVKAVLRMSS